MTYRDSLSPWCIIQHLPKMQRIIIARFRKRNDAEDHLRILKRLNPTITYELLFDPPNALPQDPSREWSNLSLRSFHNHSS